jgi:hypothetical protein
MVDRSSPTRLLRIFTATLENLDQDQMDLLMAGKGRLTFTATGRTKEANSEPSVDQSDILARFNDCKDREEARRVLSSIMTRDALAAFVRGLKVHIVKHDRREDIESKIIEFGGGGKLRTEAIQSLNLKRGGNAPSEDQAKAP